MPVQLLAEFFDSPGYICIVFQDCLPLQRFDVHEDPEIIKRSSEIVLRFYVLFFGAAGTPHRPAFGSLGVTYPRRRLFFIW